MILFRQSDSPSICYLIKKFLFDDNFECERVRRDGNLIVFLITKTVIYALLSMYSSIHPIASLQDWIRHGRNDSEYDHLHLHLSSFYDYYNSYAYIFLTASANCSSVAAQRALRSCLFASWPASFGRDGRQSSRYAPRSASVPTLGATQAKTVVAAPCGMDLEVIKFPARRLKKLCCQRFVWITPGCTAAAVRRCTLGSASSRQRSASPLANSRLASLLCPYASQAR
mmetsp:Transcript_9548/g.15742  ORF Transcript_9548/g.15742 Transcript_9548/m.15742 type:complete len:227 (-) Transcript_9548:652-1332(-)